MPELPEVETIRRDLRPLVLGRRIVAVRIHAGAERLAVTHSPRELEHELAERRIEEIGRHGKYLLIALDDGRTWVAHLRMTGSLVHVTSGEAAGRFERARVDLDDGHAVVLNDVRKFATWHLVDNPSEAMPRIGPDALSAEFTVRSLRDALERRSVAVKAALLDQKVAAGVGNIYADEALWIARIDPRTPSNTLGPRRVRRLHAAVIEALERSLGDRGSSFSDYRDGLGAEGLHHVHVHVFRRDGQPCDRCGTTIRKLRVAGRGTHMCVRCQRR